VTNLITPRETVCEYYVTMNDCHIMSYSSEIKADSRRPKMQ